MHFRNIPFPVSVTGIDGGSPLEGIGPPRILCAHLASFEYGLEEIKYKQQLNREHHNRNHGDHLVQVGEIIE